jgi:hypothetical protein
VGVSSNRRFPKRLGHAIQHELFYEIVYVLAPEPRREVGSCSFVTSQLQDNGPRTLAPEFGNAIELELPCVIARPRAITRFTLGESSSADPALTPAFPLLDGDAGVFRRAP